ncbi:hypothetical protein G7054_g10052 [Neopestalotiopsis clavispora]|nr:hypothetical protein G7054_g10052 [Neopestalotiopsis clavispora]
MATSFGDRRLANIKENQALLQDVEPLVKPEPDPKKKAGTARPPAAKRRKFDTGQPVRTSARIASSAARPTYNEDALSASKPERSVPRGKNTARKGAALVRKRAVPVLAAEDSDSPGDSRASAAARPDLDSLRAGWTSWTPEAAPPTRDDVTGEYRFASHPDFTPNKSPEEIMREGCFGGSYWRPLYSRHLRTTVEDDWRELPGAWTEGLDVARYLTSPDYDESVNKYGRACGQSIEEWEANGWINHNYDVRGWFQWYCRFWMGRRCDDDDRQISRWKKCVGPTGRWRRILLKKYVQTGIRSVFDEDDDIDGEKADVSPVVHQTCHHWAYEVRQEALDRFWAEGK